MARVLLVGEGPLPSSDPEVLGFPQLRCESFLEVLREAGHVVELAPVELLDLEGARALKRRFGPEVVVSAGPYEPARVAAQVVDDEPLFVDVPGDPFAEAQAKSTLAGEADHSGPMRQAWLGAYARADAFGVISTRQRLALLGQLGVLGRLTLEPAETRWVEVLPAAYRFGRLPERAPRAREPGAPLTVALVGGFNTWLDVETLLEGLCQALSASPDLKVVCTGGAIAGHHSAGFERFRSGIEARGHGARVAFEGWVPHARLGGLMALADVGVTLDRPGLEPELGTRTRVLFYAHQGLQVVSTPRGELCAELAELELTRPVPAGDPQALAEALLELQARGWSGERSLQRHLRATASPQVALAGLLEWVRAPQRRAPLVDRQLELIDELNRLRGELKAVHQSPTWRASAALRRALKRES